MSALEPEAWAAELPDLVQLLATDSQQGLSPEEAARRLAADGPNELQRGADISPPAILAQQFRSLVVWLLIGARRGTFPFWLHANDVKVRCSLIPHPLRLSLPHFR